MLFIVVYVNVNCRSDFKVLPHEEMMEYYPVHRYMVVNDLYIFNKLTVHLF